MEHREGDLRAPVHHGGQADDPARFLRELRRLRDEAGLGSDELAARAHYPCEAIRAAEAGPGLPDLPVLSAYVRSCGGAVGEWEERWRTLTSSPALPLLSVRAAGCSEAATAGARVGSASFAPDGHNPAIVMAALSRVASGITAERSPAPFASASASASASAVPSASPAPEAPSVWDAVTAEPESVSVFTPLDRSPMPAPWDATPPESVFTPLDRGSSPADLDRPSAWDRDTSQAESAFTSFDRASAPADLEAPSAWDAVAAEPESASTSFDRASAPADLEAPSPWDTVTTEPESAFTPFDHSAAPADLDTPSAWDTDTTEPESPSTPFDHSAAPADLDTPSAWDTDTTEPESPFTSFDESPPQADLDTPSAWDDATPESVSVFTPLDRTPAPAGPETPWAWDTTPPEPGSVFTPLDRTPTPANPDPSATQAYPAPLTAADWQPNWPTGPAGSMSRRGASPRARPSKPLIGAIVVLVCLVVILLALFS